MKNRVEIQKAHDRLAAEGENPARGRMPS